MKKPLIGVMPLWDEDKKSIWMLISGALCQRRYLLFWNILIVENETEQIRDWAENI